jgi:hypothetical protein
VKLNTVIVPPATAADPDAFETARAWIAHGAQHVSLRHAVWADPAAWGIRLLISRETLRTHSPSPVANQLTRFDEYATTSKLIWDRQPMIPRAAS